MKRENNPNSSGPIRRATIKLIANPRHAPVIFPANTSAVCCVRAFIPDHLFRIPANTNLYVHTGQGVRIRLPHHNNRRHREITIAPPCLEVSTPRRCGSRPLTSAPHNAPIPS